MNINLNNENSLGKGIIFWCCDDKYMSKNNQLETCTEITCQTCNKPVAVKGSHDNIWYYVGEKVFDK